MEMKCPMCGKMMDIEIKAAGKPMMDKENPAEPKAVGEEPDMMKTMKSKQMKMGKY